MVDLTLDVVIVGAARTPVGAFNGALSSLSAHELGARAIAAALERAGVAPAVMFQKQLWGRYCKRAKGRTRPARLR